MSAILGIVILGRVSLEVATQPTQALFQELWPSSQRLPATAVMGGENKANVLTFGAVPSRHWQMGGVRVSKGVVIPARM